MEAVIAVPTTLVARIPKPRTALAAAAKSQWVMHYNNANLSTRMTRSGDLIPT